MFALGLIPALLMTPGLIASLWLSGAGNETMGHVVRTRDIGGAIDEVHRTGKQPTVVATIEYMESGVAHRLEWLGWMSARGLGGKRLPVVGDSLPILYLNGHASLARVDRFADVWLPHGLLWPASMVFVLAGGALSFGQFVARRRGIELAMRHRVIVTENVQVEDDDSYTDGSHFRYVAEFEVDGRRFLSRSPTVKKQLSPLLTGKVLYSPEDPSVNWLEADV